MHCMICAMAVQKGDKVLYLAGRKGTVSDVSEGGISMTRDADGTVESHYVHVLCIEAVFDEPEPMGENLGEPLEPA